MRETALLLAVGLCCGRAFDVAEGVGGWLGKIGDSLNCRLPIADGHSIGDSGLAIADLQGNPGSFYRPGLVFVQDPQSPIRNRMAIGVADDFFRAA